MLPRWHIILGAIFTIILWIAVPGISFFYLILDFFASFLIDVDHYVASIINSGRIISLKDSFEYHRIKEIQQQKEISRGIRKKSDFHLFHTLEFHLLVGLLGIFWIGFFYIFIGMVFHSLIDIYDGLRKGWLHRREFFFFNWLAKRF